METELLQYVYRVIVTCFVAVGGRLNFFPYFLFSLFTHLLNFFLLTSSRIGLFRFQAGGRRGQPNLALVVCVYFFFSTLPSDLLGKTSPK